MADCNHGADLLEDGEFWLPPQFLCDDESSPEEGTFPLKFGRATVAGFFPPVEYGTGWRTSNLSSLGESVVGSTEDFDEDDFIADLTRKVAQSTLVDGFPTLRSSKGLYSSGSPKSTLCDGCGQSSLWENPSSAAQLKSPPPQMLDLRYQAAGKVANMRINQQRQQIERVQYLQQQRRRLNQLVHPCDSKSEVSPYPYQAYSRQRLSSSAWPTLLQARQPHREPVSACVNGRRTVMPAVFLGSNNVYHRGSVGTGVFLPRQAGSNPQPKRKQQSCSMVLIPAKVVQALNLNLDKMDGAWRIRSGRQVTPQPMGRHRLLQAAVSQEISLPQGWTY